jgi:hypothetical protein
MHYTVTQQSGKSRVLAYILSLVLSHWQQDECSFIWNAKFIALKLESVVTGVCSHFIIIKWKLISRKFYFIS